MTTASIVTIAAEAEKLFDDTGSLQGLSASCQTGYAEGVTALSVSAIATDASVEKDGVILAYTLDVNTEVGKAGAKEHGLSAQQLAELMDFLSGLRTTAARKAAARSNRPSAKNTPAPVRAHA